MGIRRYILSVCSCLLSTGCVTETGRFTLNPITTGYVLTAAEAARLEQVPGVKGVFDLVKDNGRNSDTITVSFYPVHAAAGEWGQHQPFEGAVHHAPSFDILREAVRAVCQRPPYIGVRSQSLQEGNVSGAPYLLTSRCLRAEPGPALTKNEHMQIKAIAGVRRVHDYSGSITVEFYPAERAEKPGDWTAFSGVAADAPSLFEIEAVLAPVCERPPFAGARSVQLTEGCGFDGGLFKCRKKGARGYRLQTHCGLDEETFRAQFPGELSFANE